MRQSEAPAGNTSISFVSFLTFLVFFCVNTGENWGCLRPFFGVRQSEAPPGRDVDFRDVEKIDIFDDVICVS